MSKNTPFIAVGKSLAATLLDFMNWIAQQSMMSVVLGVKRIPFALKDSLPVHGAKVGDTFILLRKVIESAFHFRKALSPSTPSPTSTNGFAFS